MIDLEYVLANVEEYKKQLENRQLKLADLKLDNIQTLYKERKVVSTKVQELQRQRNLLSGEVSQRQKAKELKASLQEAEKKLREKDQTLKQLAYSLPNLTNKDVPVGKSDKDNVMLKEVGNKPTFDFEAKDYMALCEGLIDTKRASKVAGTRFGYLFGDIALLELALIKFAFDMLVPQGFTPVIPPVMIKPDKFRGMGRLSPGQEEERYFIAKDNLYLVGSAEHTIGPIHSDEMLQASQLPIRYVGFSTCFRREAGSYGKDTKGILRVHQFDKAEMFSFTKPEDSEQEHQFLLARQEELMQKLELPYRVMQICTGDLGFTDYKAYDIETWMPGEGTYRETHSCSNTTDFQARGINVKYRLKTEAEGSKTEYVHMLNATAFAIGRILIAIIENNQQKNGSILIPKVLQPYVGKSTIFLS